MSKKLVAYFSPTGTTAKAAQAVADAVGADMFEIKPAVPYTAADLDWMDSRSRSTLEMKDDSSRPAIAEKCASMAEYDVVYLGFPIWWYVAPTIVNAFLESYDLSGKTVVVFATSGTSGMGSYHGKKSFETFTHFRSMVWKSTWMDLPMRYHPYTDKKDKLVRFFLR